MTTLTDLIPEPATPRSIASVPVFGVPWPVNKLAAVVAGVLAAVLTFVITASGVAAMWVSAVVVLAVWWGGFRLLAVRWDDGGRDFIAENRPRR
ncbi:MAG: hypothetical protein WBA05_01830 [Gordonia sp. (in: high G+C Gram-positive bacteria)]|uniref:hypothetical protein n=1 Tax=Gordonia sp. (in: high G+C Gram-positive bacteria) TaxID=84139 RepID=UPI003C767D9C